MNERYLTSFEDQTSALDYTSGDTTLVSPQVSLIGTDVVYSKEIPSESRIRFAKDEETGKLYFIVEGVLPPNVDVVGPADNEIWYTTSDGNVAEFQPLDYFDDDDGHQVFYNTVVSNVYENNKGVITFQKPLEKFSGDGTLGALFYDEEFNIQYHDKITSIILPNSVKTLEEFPFGGLMNVQEIIIPNSVTSLGTQALASTRRDNPKYIYKGTMAEFKAISTNEYSFITSAGELIIHCTDGDITIPASN